MKTKTKLIKIIDSQCESTFEFSKNSFSYLKKELKELNDYKGYDKIGKENLMRDFKIEFILSISDLKEIVFRKVDNIRMKQPSKKKEIIKEIVDNCNRALKWLDYACDEMWDEIKKLETSESDEEKWWLKVFEMKFLNITKNLKKLILETINSIKESSIISIWVPSNINFVCGSCDKIYKGYCEDYNKVRFKQSGAIKEICEMCYANEYYNLKEPIDFDKAYKNWYKIDINKIRRKKMNKKNKMKIKKINKHNLFYEGQELNSLEINKFGNVKMNYKYPVINFRKKVQLKNITDIHERDCCESVFVNWESLNDTLISKNEYFVGFRKIKDKGIRLITDYDMEYFVPAYNMQNGYYGSDLIIRVTYDLNKPNKYKDYDITDCTEYDEI